MADVAAVEVRALRRTFPAHGGSERVALDGIDLVVEAGEVHGLLGPNGAGKTTLCKILSTVLLPTSGTAQVLGHDVVAGREEVRTVVGVVFGGERGLYPRLSAAQNLRYWASMYGLTGRAARQVVAVLLERVGLSDRAGDRVETLSRGMKQRLHLARGLVGDPRVLILDEPTAGMDPMAARDFRGLVEDVRGEGRAVLLTTHDMTEAEALCDHVSFVDGGRLLGTERPHVVGRLLAAHDRIEVRGLPPGVARELVALAGVTAVREVGDGVTVVDTSAPDAVAGVLRLLLDCGVTAVSTRMPSLEEVYLHILGNRGLRV